LRYSGIGESCHATTNRYKHKLYCTHVLSCTYSTFCNVIHLIIRVLSSRSIISNTCCTVCLPMKAELHFLPCCHTNLPNTATPYGQYGRPCFCGYMACHAVMCKCGLHPGSPIQTSTDGIAGCLLRVLFSICASIRKVCPNLVSNECLRAYVIKIASLGIGMVELFQINWLSCLYRLSG